MQSVDRPGKKISQHAWEQKNDSESAHRKEVMRSITGGWVQQSTRCASQTQQLKKCLAKFKDKFQRGHLRLEGRYPTHALLFSKPSCAALSTMVVNVGAKNRPRINASSCYIVSCTHHGTCLSIDEGCCIGWDGIVHECCSGSRILIRASFHSMAS